MITVLAAIALLGQDAPASRMIYIGDPDKPTTRLAIFIRDERMATPKLSPKKFGDPPQPLQFEWAVGGLARKSGMNNASFEAKFRVFSQERKAENDPAPKVVRMLLRMWECNALRFSLDHAKLYNDGTVDVYLCWGGQAGGEQRFDDDEDATGLKKVNTIYIYDLNSFKNPVEMAREVAHEYGHATLPGVGGFKEPEDWGNGYLGEKIFMRYLRDELKAKRIEPIDVMGCTLEQLEAWVKAHVDPLTQKAADDGPMFGLLEGTGAAAMDAYLGLNLLLEQILPPRQFAMILRETAYSEAKGYADAVIRSVENNPTGTVLEIPPILRKQLWVPVGRGSVRNADVVKKNRGWWLIKPGLGVVTILPPK